MQINGNSGNSGTSSGETEGENESSSGNENSSTRTPNDNNGAANGNTNNTGGSQNQSSILFPIDGEVSELESELIGMIKTTRKHKNYELIEYVNDVNREHVEVLQELNINGIMDTSYTYGNEILTNEWFTGAIAYNAAINKLSGERDTDQSKDRDIFISGINLGFNLAFLSIVEHLLGYVQSSGLEPGSGRELVMQGIDGSTYSVVIPEAMVGEITLTPGAASAIIQQIASDCYIYSI